MMPLCFWQIRWCLLTMAAKPKQGRCLSYARRCAIGLRPRRAVQGCSCLLCCDAFGRFSAHAQVAALDALLAAALALLDDATASCERTLRGARSDAPAGRERGMSISRVEEGAGASGARGRSASLSRKPAIKRSRSISVESARSLVTGDDDGTAVGDVQLLIRMIVDGVRRVTPAGSAGSNAPQTIDFSAPTVPLSARGRRALALALVRFAGAHLGNRFVRVCVWGGVTASDHGCVFRVFLHAALAIPGTSTHGAAGGGEGLQVGGRGAAAGLHCCHLRVS